MGEADRSDYLFDKTGEDPAVAELEALLGGYAHRAPLREPPARRRRRPAITAVTAAVLVMAAVAAIVIWRRDDHAAGCPSAGAGFAFAVAGGPARCGGGVALQGTLPVGAWLETPGGAVADVRVADIGKLTVYGDSRVRLVGTGATGHHLELARGKVSARVTAPPRLFVVDTPVATAVDLGCAYELTVEADGRTWLRVTSGVVSLEGHGLVAYAPAGTEVLAAPGKGPGTPVAISASNGLRGAVARFDGGDTAAVGTIVEAAEADDTVTLWNLLSRTAAAERAAVFARLDVLSPHPPGVRAEDVLAGDAGAILAWRRDLDASWSCANCRYRSKAPPPSKRKD
jgi:hypothetical protein